MGPAKAQAQYLLVRGTSMWPELREGDLLVVRPGSYEPGDIIVVQKAGFSLTHRVLQTTPQILTKGDNLHFVDQVVQPAEVVGVAQYVLRRSNRMVIDVGSPRRKAARLFYTCQELYYFNQVLSAILTTSARKRGLKTLTQPLYLLHYWLSHRRAGAWPH